MRRIIHWKPRLSVLQPVVGRFFDEAGDVSGGGKEGWTALVSDSYWKTHPSIVGQTIAINRLLIHVAGVRTLRELDVEPFTEASDAEELAAKRGF